jgi:O-antigen ligase
MTLSRTALFRAAHWVTLASALSILLSIAVSQILLGVALVLLLASREPLRLPRIKLPLALFLLGTLVSLAFSPEPMHGLPQVKKMFVFTMLLVVFSTLRESQTAGRLFLAWAAVGAFVACWGVVQFVVDIERAQAQHVNFYEYYLPRRITGAMSHWMTFAGQEMLVFLMLIAFLLFGPKTRRFWLWSACAVLLALAELLNETRTVWLGIAVGCFFLLWKWNRKVAILAPPIAIAALWFAPGQIHDRFVSMFKPKEVDSNTFRYIMDLTGIQMVKAHPLLGIGPEEAKYHMMEWIPRDVPRPLPAGFYQHLHNLYLQYAAERGIPTMLMLVWMLLMILYDFSKGLHQLAPGRSNERFLLVGGISCVLGIMVSGIFEVNLGDSEVLTAFLVVVGCGYLAIPVTGKESPLRAGGDG